MNRRSFLKMTSVAA
ncbi:twin-arginine translocation signal domain-containing protein [Edaphobacter albus]|nr:twin-arginine translocation signal domain-containing protein [Edaphobacter sp. 4G125]